MQWKTVIKRLHGALTAILLLIVISFIALNSSDERSEERLISSRQLNENTWLYVTGYSGGGATVANSYRYYLSGKIEGDIGASLAKQVPFLIAAGSGANVTMDGDVIDIKYGGRVFSFNNSVIYEYRGETFRPHLNFQASNELLYIVFPAPCHINPVGCHCPTIAIAVPRHAKTYIARPYPLILRFVLYFILINLYRGRIAPLPEKRMTLRAAIVLLTGGLPFFASAHNFVEGERVAPVGVAERGELQLQQGELRYQAWNSARLSGKVSVVLHMAGRLSAKDQNAALIDAIGKAGFPANRFAVTTIVNTDDAIPGSALFVRRSLEESKRETPAAQFVVDDRGATQRAWRLQTGGSAIVVLDKGGRVRFAKDGALTAAEVDQVMVLLRQLLA